MKIYDIAALVFGGMPFTKIILKKSQNEKQEKNRKEIWSILPGGKR